MNRPFTQKSLQAHKLQLSIKHIICIFLVKPKIFSHFLFLGAVVDKALNRTPFP